MSLPDLSPLMDAAHAILGRSSNTINWWQMSVRAVIVLFVGLALIRFSGKRTFSRESPLDLVVALVIGSNLSRTLTGNAPLIPVVVASTLLVVLYRFLAHAAWNRHWMGYVLKGQPRCLIRDGKIDRLAMQQESISAGDLEEALRDKGVDDASEVRLATLERGGQISVLRK